MCGVCVLETSKKGGLCLIWAVVPLEKNVRHKHSWSNIRSTDFLATLLIIYSLCFKLDSVKSNKCLERIGELFLNFSGCLYNDVTGFNCGSVAVRSHHRVIHTWTGDCCHVNIKLFLICHDKTTLQAERVSHLFFLAVATPRTALQIDSR